MQELARLATYDDKKAYFERFAAEVDGVGYVSPCADGRLRVLKRGAFEKAHESAGKVPVPDKPKRTQPFIARWFGDASRRIVQRLTYAPQVVAYADPGTLNMFRGFGPIAGGPALSLDRVAALVAPWRAIGLQLCEGEEDKWQLMEQWLAHIVQFPEQRSNISFALVGAKQGCFKTAFFEPFGHILGPHNYSRSLDIHHFVESSHERTKLAGQLLCVHDEAKPEKTKLFQNQIKETVTGTFAKSMRDGEASYELPAVHRLVVLSNYLDGLAVDFGSGNRRFVLYEPTSVFTPGDDGGDDGAQRLSPPARQRFDDEYVRRFIGADSERGPDDVECLRALYQHLKAVVRVGPRSTAEWVAALFAIMRGSKFGTPRELKSTPPSHVRFLHDLTAEAFVEGAPLIHGGPGQGVYESKDVGYEHPMRQLWEDPRDYDDRITDPTPDPERDRVWHRYVIAKDQLYALYIVSQFCPRQSPPTQNKFSLDVSQYFCRAASLRGRIDGFAVVTARDDEHAGKLAGGVRVWRFRTQHLRRILLQDYPSLEHCKSRAKVIAELERDIMDGSMFPPLGQQQP